jgi:hypothetical protein
MAIERSRERLAGRIRGILDGSGVNLSWLSDDERERLVARLTDGVLATLDELLDEEDAERRPAAPSGDEQVLWAGRPFLSIGEHYTVTNERVRVERGVLSRRTDDIELVRLQDIDLSQGLTERMMNVGDITLRGSGAAELVLVLRNVREPDRVQEIIRRAMLEARRRHGLQFRETL